MNTILFYTFSQFNYIVISTFLILVSIVNTMSCYYRNNSFNLKLILLFINIMSILLLLDCFMAMLSTSILVSNLLYMARGIIFALISISYIVLYFNVYKNSPLTKYINLRLRIAFILTLFVIGIAVLGYMNILFSIIITSFNILHTYLISNRLNDYWINKKVYEYVKSGVEDIVFIINNSGDVVYENVGSESKEIDISKYSGDITNIFILGAIKESQYTNTYISDNKYYQVIKTQLERGTIFTIVNVTETMLMLKEIERQEYQLKKTNELLIENNLNVYELEKEKEINRILKEIARTRLININKMSKEIKNLDLNDKNISKKIEELIEAVKSELIDTRETVSIYLSTRR